MPNRRLNLTGLDIIRGFFRLIVISFVFLPFLSDIWADRFLAKDAGEPGFRNKIFRFFARRIVKKRVLHGIDLIKKRAVRLREILIKLGPAFIKIGQAMATRPDLVPVPYLKELEKLQDDVPPFSNRRARKIIEKDLKTKIKVIFPEMEESPVAAASLGQVYRARLREGTWVAVKVQRPGIARLLRKDFAALRILAGFAEKRKAIGLGINWTDAVNDFYVMISQEMNYRQEVENARTFRKNFASWKDIHVPRIYSEYSGNRTITMEFIDGIKLNDREGLTAQGVEPMEAIEIVTRSYLKQLIEDGFFHADPHPGNLRLMYDGRLAFFDFGMVGRMNDLQRARFLDLLIHVGERDIHGIVQDLHDLGFLRSGSKSEEFFPAIEEIFNKYLGQAQVGQVRFHELVYALSEVIYRYPFTIPSQFAFILRAILTLEGLGLFFDPDFSLFRLLKPHAVDFLFFRELREFFQRLLFISGTDTREPFSWDRTKKLLGIFWKQYKKRIFPEDEEEEDEEVEGELEGPANAGLIEEGGTV